MRCKKHLSDGSSVVGVCASCLRERLLTIIERQSQYEDEVLVEPQVEDAQRKPDATNQHVTFPRSVSPYVSRRRSDNTAVWPHVPHSLSEQRFYSTPEIGPNRMIMTAESSSREPRAGKFRLSDLSNLFRSKTSKFEPESNLDFGAGKRQEKSNSINSTMTEAQHTKPPSSWFKKLFRSEKKSNSHIVSLSFPDEYEYSCETCPKSTPMQATSQRRKQNQGLSFCLSPLVRPSPSRSWNQKGALPEMVIQRGDTKVSPGRPSLGVAASFRANRSRKLANFGRFRPNY